MSPLRMICFKVHLNALWHGSDLWVSCWARGDITYTNKTKTLLFHCNCNVCGADRGKLWRVPNTGSLNQKHSHGWQVSWSSIGVNFNGHWFKSFRRLFCNTCLLGQRWKKDPPSYMCWFDAWSHRMGLVSLLHLWRGLGSGECSLIRPQRTIV